MPNILPYNRELAVQYAMQWALGRNPKYFDFEKIGGDCTNFVSQSLLAGKCAMNYTKTHGWYYSNPNNKSPSWTGVSFLYNFLINNKILGPFAVQADMNSIEVGDIVQINFEEDAFYDHSLIITIIKHPISMQNIFVCSHTYNRLNQPLSSINFKKARFLHIGGSYI